MSAGTTKLLTAEEFYDWCHRPENRDRIFELERGEVIELSRPGVRHGVVCINVGYVLANFVRQRRRGYVCGNDTGVVWERDPDTVRGPDAILYDESRRYEELEIKYSERIPQLVVEVISPTDRWNKVLRRLTQFIERGTPMAWLVDPDDRTVTVLQPDQLPRVYEETDELTGGEVLPDLRFPVAELFFVPGEDATTSPPGPATG